MNLVLLKYATQLWLQISNSIKIFSNEITYTQPKAHVFSLKILDNLLSCAAIPLT